MKTREIILSGTQHLLENNKLEKITIQDILDEVGISRATFYKYFNDKYDLLTAYYMDYLMKEDLLASSHENIQKRLRILFSFIEKNKRYIRRLLETQGQNSFRSFLQDRTISEYVNELTVHYDLNSSELAEYLFTAHFNASYAIMERWVLDDCRQSSDFIADIVLKIEEGIFRIHTVF